MNETTMYFGGFIVYMLAMVVFVRLIDANARKNKRKRTRREVRRIRRTLQRFNRIEHRIR